MVSITSLLLPILLSAAFVFIVSSIIHMLLPYHKSDRGKLPNEDAVMDALRPLNIPPGDYSVPYPESIKHMGSPEHIEKMKKGPVMLMTVMKNGPYAMGGPMALWFVFGVLVSFFAAYVAGRALTPGAHYLAVFRFTGVTAFLAYGLGALQESIWYARPWSTTIKNVFDGLVYALVTAGTFGWLWPVV
ncbi:MAG: hypothetical protein HY962_14135 [Ignavibacteriae bacterium]|nr:hypothetical protein [Ignavibacteriota bacterium]